MEFLPGTRVSHSLERQDSEVDRICIGMNFPVLAQSLPADDSHQYSFTKTMLPILGTEFQLNEVTAPIKRAITTRQSQRQRAITFSSLGDSGDIQQSLAQFVRCLRPATRRRPTIEP